MRNLVGPVTVLLGSLGAASSLAQVIPVAPLAPPAPRFASYTELYDYIARDANLGAAGTPEAAREIAASSSVAQLRDYSGEAIAVVGVDEHGRRPTTHPPHAEQVFYVLRDTDRGLTLLGTMQGSGYQTSTASRHLEFRVSSRDAAGHPTHIRYQIDGNHLINVSTLAQTLPSAKIKPDWNTAF
jgi:hypothetical protein